MITAVAVMVAAAALGLAWYRAQRSEPPLKPLVRLNVDLGSGVAIALSAISGTNVLLSPDGHRLAFISESKIFTMRLDQSSATELPGTQGACLRSRQTKIPELNLP